MVIKPQMTGKFSQARLAYSPGHFFCYTCWRVIVWLKISIPAMPLVYGYKF